MALDIAGEPLPVGHAVRACDCHQPARFRASFAEPNRGGRRTGSGLAVSTRARWRGSGPVLGEQDHREQLTVFEACRPSSLRCHNSHRGDPAWSARDRSRSAERDRPWWQRTGDQDPVQGQSEGQRRYGAHTGHGRGGGNWIGERRERTPDGHRHALSWQASRNPSAIRPGPTGNCARPRPAEPASSCLRCA